MFRFVVVFLGHENEFIVFKRFILFVIFYFLHEKKSEIVIMLIFLKKIRRTDTLHLSSTLFFFNYSGRKTGL